MNKYILLLLITTFCYTSNTIAQHQEVHEKEIMYKSDNNNANNDSTSLLHAFKKGTFNGHLRYFFSVTDNSKNLTDYFANAVGGGLRYETSQFHGFQFALSGFYIFNLGSSDFTKPDASTGQLNRYEIALFDVEDPTNKKDLDRLEELYLKYNFKKSFVIFGRQLINTPFINLQDGRMRPTGVEGIWTEINEIKKTKIQVGWLYAISPRGTTKWFNIGESIGIYPTGINPDGSKSNQTNNIESKGIGIIGVNTNFTKKIKVQGWNMLVENVSNSIMLQADINYPLNNRSSVFGALQFIRQDAVNFGGNAIQSKTYIEPGSKAITWGARVGWKRKQIEATLNYNRITEDGRYLVPREWGREPFFTFLPRERNEGLGDVHAFMGQIKYNPFKERVKTSLGVGYYKLPDVKNFALNKYGLTSYTQINADIRYNFIGLLNGLEAQLLIVHKLNNGNVYDNDKFIINKVDMSLYNLVLNFHF